MNQDLIKAYLNTTYRAFNAIYNLFKKSLSLCANLLSAMSAPIAVPLLKSCFDRTNSFLLSASENKQLQENLIEEIKKLNYTFYYAEGIPNNTDWKIEPSLFILNITEENTNYLMDKYNQNAVVRVQAENKIVELFFNSKLSIKNLRLNIVNF